MPPLLLWAPLAPTLHVYICVLIQATPLGSAHIPAPLPAMPSASAFVQQRSKIKPEAFRDILAGFTKKITGQSSHLRLLSVDGSDIQIATNPDDEDTYFPGTNGQKPYSLIHLNALYDLEQHIYVDSRIQGRMASFQEEERNRISSI